MISMEFQANFFWALSSFHAICPDGADLNFKAEMLGFPTFLWVF